MSALIPLLDVYNCNMTVGPEPERTELPSLVCRGTPGAVAKASIACFLVDKRTATIIVAGTLARFTSAYYCISFLGQGADRSDNLAKVVILSDISLAQ